MTRLESTIEIPALAGYALGLTYHIGHGVTLNRFETCFDLISSRKLDPESITGDQFSWDDAPAVLLDPTIRRPVFIRPGYEELVKTASVRPLPKLGIF